MGDGEFEYAARQIELGGDIEQSRASSGMGRRTMSRGYAMRTYICKTSKGGSGKVVVEEGVIVASCLVRPNPLGTWMKVSRVRTKKQFRQRGYATVLLSAVVREFGKHELRLNPRPDSTTNISYERLREFYRGFGFRDIEGQKRMVRAKNGE